MGYASTGEPFRKHSQPNGQYSRSDTQALVPTTQQQHGEHAVQPSTGHVAGAGVSALHVSQPGGLWGTSCQVFDRAGTRCSAHGHASPAAGYTSARCLNSSPSRDRQVQVSGTPVQPNRPPCNVLHPSEPDQAPAFKHLEQAFQHLYEPLTLEPEEAGCLRPASPTTQLPLSPPACPSSPDDDTWLRLQQHSQQALAMWPTTSPRRPQQLQACTAHQTWSAQQEASVLRHANPQPGTLPQLEEPRSGVTRTSCTLQQTSTTDMVREPQRWQDSQTLEQLHAGSGACPAAAGHQQSCGAEQRQCPPQLTPQQEQHASTLILQQQQWQESPTDDAWLSMQLSETFTSTPLPASAGTGPPAPMTGLPSSVVSVSKGCVESAPPPSARELMFTAQVAAQQASAPAAPYSGVQSATKRLRLAGIDSAAPRLTPAGKQGPQSQPSDPWDDLAQRAEQAVSVQDAAFPPLPATQARSQRIMPKVADHPDAKGNALVERMLNADAAMATSGDGDESEQGRQVRAAHAQQRAQILAEDDKWLDGLEADGSNCGDEAQQAAAGEAACDGSARDAVQPCPMPVVRAGQLSLLTWNLWFNEVQLRARMKAIGNVIVEKGYPDFLCFQEMTHKIYGLMSAAPWWAHYTASPAPGFLEYFTCLLWRTETVVPTGPVHHRIFSNTVMTRGVQMVSAIVCGTPVRIANSHLESPMGMKKYIWQRNVQCKQGFEWLEACQERNILWAGDMNWLPGNKQMPLPDGWCDAWMALRPTEAGFTYDGNANDMLGQKGPNAYRSRLDRVLCKLRDWRPVAIERVGLSPLSKVMFDKVAANGSRRRLPVLPSDHFGVLVRLQKHT